MTSVSAVASYLPERRVPIDEHFADLGITEDPVVYRRYFGFAAVRRDPCGNLVEQMCRAAGRLTELAGREEDVRFVVHAPTIQLTAPHPGNPVRDVCRRLGLTRAVPFSLTQLACASALLAVDACGKLLAADPDPRAVALVLAGEKTFTRPAQIIPNSAVIGEGMAALLVSAHGERNKVLSYASRTLGEFHEAPDLSEELDAKFQAAYPGVMIEVLRAAVARAGLAMEDIKLILPHNINRMSWLRVLMTAGLPKSLVYLENQSEYGHCFGADTFISYQTAAESGRLEPGDHYVMTGAGLGATIAAMVLRA